MKNSSIRMLLVIILIIIGAWLVWTFLNEIPKWVLLVVIAILIILNWGKIKRMLRKL